MIYFGAILHSIIESGNFLRRYYLKNLECVEVTEVDFVTFFVLRIPTFDQPHLLYG